MERNKEIASLRIHVKRCIERMKNWHIFDKRIPITLAPIASDMFIVIGALTTFCHLSLIEQKLSTFKNTIILFVCPRKFCISIVSSFSWDLQWSQEKIKTKSIMVFLKVA